MANRDRIRVDGVLSSPIHRGNAVLNGMGPLGAESVPRSVNIPMYDSVGDRDDED